MSVDLEPRNPGVCMPGFPNGFWVALCVETPVSSVLGCEYTNRRTIKYSHDGFVGDWIDETHAEKMHQLLVEYVKTDEYNNHRYFSERKD